MYCTVCGISLALVQYYRGNEVFLFQWYFVLLLFFLCRQSLDLVLSQIFFLHVINFCSVVILWVYAWCYCSDVSQQWPFKRFCCISYFTLYVVKHCLGTGIRGLMRATNTLPQGNQKPLVVEDKVGRPQMSLGWQSPWNVILFLPCCATVGWKTGRASCP